MRPRPLLAAALLLASVAVPAARGGPVLDTAREYRASLDRLLPFQEAVAQRAATRLERGRELLARGFVAAREVEDLERALDEARARVERTRAETQQADALVREAEVQEHLASVPARSGLVFGPTFTVFRSASAWSLREAGEVERFFTARFGRALPVSALGQTPLHARLGFDHRNALDVAVHPDTDEGRTLTAWLQGRGVPFIAFRGSVPGVATGAHVHVGEPSPRLSMLGR
ncbi:MAG: hypothetical protein ACRELS_14855 [Candidatus Rokuibacteriota bacterium]